MAYVWFGDFLGLEAEGKGFYCSRARGSYAVTGQLQIRRRNTVRTFGPNTAPPGPDPLAPPCGGHSRESHGGCSEQVVHPFTGCQKRLSRPFLVMSGAECPSAHGMSSGVPSVGDVFRERPASGSDALRAPMTVSDRMHQGMRGKRSADGEVTRSAQHDGEEPREKRRVLLCSIGTEAGPSADAPWRRRRAGATVFRRPASVCAEQISCAARRVA